MGELQGGVTEIASGAVEGAARRGKRVTPQEKKKHGWKARDGRPIVSINGYDCACDEDGGGGGCVRS